jgi:shikimate dehydrogenase
MHQLDGINVTLPHKTAIIPYLDRLEPAAQKAGAVNTVYWKNGQVIGANTDGIVFIRALTERRPSFQKTLVLGAGGAARGIIAALPGDVTLTNRTEERSRAVAAEFGTHVLPWHETFDLTSYDVIINTTSVGRAPHVEARPIELTVTNALICDIIYRPTPTCLLREATEKGLDKLDGVPMFVLKAAEARERFTGQARDLALGEQVIRKQLEEF